MRDEILVIDSYATTPRRVAALAAAVRAFGELGRDLCLVSHAPIPENVITKNVRYVIYDSNNLMGAPATVFFRARDFEVRYEPADAYHGPAVYGNLYNALRTLMGRYAWVHFVECDVAPDDVARHLADATRPYRDDPATKALAYRFPVVEAQYAPLAIQTLLLSLRPEIVQQLPLVVTYEDYLACVPHPAVLEVWLGMVLTARGVMYRLLDAPPIRHGSNAGGDHAVIRCRQHDGRLTIFVVNRSKGPAHVRFSTGEVANMTPGDLAWKSDLPTSIEVTVEDGAGTMHYTVADMRPGIFKKQGHDLCPDWR